MLRTIGQPREFCVFRRNSCASTLPARLAARSSRADSSFPTEKVEGRPGTLLAPTDSRMSSYPTHPPHPERVCWGCDQYCPADDLTCGKDTVRTPHPIELFGDDWKEWAESRDDTPDEMTRSRVVEALRCVLDPEVGINIVDLGVLHEIHVSGSAIRISLTLTSPSCPLGEQIRLETARRVSTLKGVTDVEVTEIWDPPWSAERMSPAAREALGSQR